MRRRTLITGGSRGIGYATASRLLNLGFDVIITGRSQSSLDHAVSSLSRQGNIEALAFDFSDANEVQKALHDLDVDVLIANVGIGFSGTVAKTSLDEWNEVFATNVTSAFVAIKEVLGGMLEKEWGRIVTVGSLASHEAIRSGVAYVSSKHALWGLTRAVAMDTLGKGVTANMVAPTFVRTDMTAQNVDRIVAASGLNAEVAEQKLAALSTFNRLLEPDEVAIEIARFVTAEADHITGTSVAMGFDVRAL